MSIAELRALSPAEKLEVIDTLWRDLAAADEPLISPEWHAAKLAETAKDYDAGKLRGVDWEAAKRQLRQDVE